MQGLKKLPREAIEKLWLLETVVLPASIEEIGLDNFSLSFYLSEVIYNGTKEQWKNIKFDDLPDRIIEFEEKLKFAKSS